MITAENIRKYAGLFSTVTQLQDDHLRQIVREELSKNPKPLVPTHNTHQTKTKVASLPVAMIDGFYDELEKIANLTMSTVVPKPTISSGVRSSMPRNTMMNKPTPKWSQVNQASQPGPTQSVQPVLSPPIVRG